MLLALAAAAATAATPAPPVSDLCQAMLPPGLVVKLALSQSQYELPRLSDIPADVLKTNAVDGGWPCPLVAIVDFDGDTRWDRALILRHKTEPTIRLVAALNLEADWEIGLQVDWPLSIGDVTLEPLAPGLYEQARSGPSAAAQFDNLASIQADFGGFLAGQRNGKQAGYFWVNGAWQHIWLTAETDANDSTKENGTP
jgi:hypothetical protein